MPRSAIAIRARTKRSVTLARERRLRNAGLIKTRRFLSADLTLAVATRLGVRLATDGLRPQEVSLGGAWHSIAVAHVAARLELAGYLTMSEQELLAEQRIYGDNHSSIEVTTPSGRTARHRPDFVVHGEDERGWAVEVELSAKAPRRLADIIRSWKLAVIVKHYPGVIYICPPEMFPLVDRAVMAADASSQIKVQVLDLPELNLPRPTRRFSGGGAPVKGRRPDPLRGSTGAPAPLPSRAGRGSSWAL